MINMRTADDDRKLSAVIRDSAMALFAERGFAAVTVRQIAATAGASPALVIHHFGSKDGLRTAIDARVAEAIEEMLVQLPNVVRDGSYQSLAAVMADWFDREPSLANYMRRMLIDGGEPADALFTLFFETATRTSDALVRAGIVREPADPAAQAAFLVGNDLAVILLRPQLERVTGVDPLSHEGLARWSAVAIDVYTNGIFTTPPPAAHPTRPAE